MNSTDAARFKALLAGVYALYGRDVSPAVASIWWATMKVYDFVAVQDALDGRDKSKGVAAEIEIAKELGIPVRYVSADGEFA